MNVPANVQSVEAVRDFRGSLLRFGEQGTGCLELLHAQLNRMIDWLDHDRPAYWQQQTRRGFDQVAEARQSLQRCQMRTVGDHRPACIEEKQALSRAKLRLEYCQQKIEAVRRCQRVVEEEANQFRGRCGELDGLLQRDLPRMTGLLDRILVSLEAYAAVATPSPPPPTVSDDTISSEGDA